MRFLLLITLLYSFAVLGDPYNGFDVSNSLISKRDIVEGGPPRDGIPAISYPKYVEASEATFMRPEDIVLGFVIDDQALAYPRHILNWHEIVNDEHGGNPFVITYCPLCGSGLAFSSNLDDQPLMFGVSGLLYNSDLLFYDRATESLWSQIEGRAISGELAGRELRQLGLEHTSWKAWRSEHPGTKVLSEDQGYKRRYRHDPYTGYETSSRLFFDTLRNAPDEFHTKERVLGLSLGDKSIAYPFSELRRQGIANFEDQLAGVKFRVLWNGEAQSATIEPVGAEVLTPTVMYWFAWYNFHADTEIFRFTSDSAAR